MGRPTVAAALAGLVIAVAAIAAHASPTGYNPNGLPTAGCFWTGPFTNTNPKTNYAYPGQHITYWGAKFRAPAGSVLVLRGHFAHARYESFNAYVNDGEATTSVPDVAIVPDRGSTNPYVAGNRRHATRRAFTLRVLAEPVPAHPARNTLYAVPGTPDATAYQDILYRVYLPDRGRDRAGGAPLPTPTLVLADGRRLKGPALCAALNSTHDYVPTLLPLATQQALDATPGKDPLVNPAVSPPVFERFFNIPYTLSFFGTAADQAATDATLKGAQYDNADNAYLLGYVSTRLGKVLVLRGKAPTTPRTYQGQRVMGTGQLRYWDVCFNEYLVTTRAHRCVTDTDTPLDASGRYTIVVSKRADRPRNATRRCGVAWLEFDRRGDGAGRTDAGLLTMRNLLPAASFPNDAHAITVPGTGPRVMGPYFPRGTYTGRSGFETRGCGAAVSAAPPHLAG